MALLPGANNAQIGLLAALPMITIFQLLSILLVQRFNNRRALSVVCIALARIPLLVVGMLVYTRTCRQHMKDAMIIGNLITWNNQSRAILKLKRKWSDVTSAASSDK
ncbi:hypothetical protein SAMN05421747_101505 [Parapedobacter composti]|uniref:Uncharacterized protein n=1 Tax=Parapedobacter composti TaxID=623281 RepID=A0A1I1EEJ6_9SPHI|nr:hypothetical protein [Parapedobacter composti]SFB85002.1 hypothetical protein SAMN05421747_101505 [Parapedobacter composti]